MKFKQQTDSPNGCAENGGGAPVVSIKNLHVAYESNLILHGVNLDVPPGQTLAILGANGSGKSTLIKAIVGCAPITKGSINLWGVDSRHNAKFSHRLGYVPQRMIASAGISATALEVVRSGLLGPGQLWFPRGSKKLALAALEQVGLAHRAKDAVHILSGGQAQRVLIARALIRNPELLIMDEPLAGIDKSSRQALAKIISNCQQRGATILLVLHETGELGPLLHQSITVAGGHLHPVTNHYQAQENCTLPQPGEKPQPGIFTTTRHP